MNELKATLDIDDEVAAKAYEKIIRRIINLDMQFKGLPPHVIKSNPRQPKRIAERTERDYLTEYLQEERRKMYLSDVTKGLLNHV